MNSIRLKRFLSAHTVLTLAVTLGGGKPHAAALFYAADDDLRLYFLTDPGSYHGRAILAQSAVAGTIQADGQPWPRITGVQFRGRCRRLVGKQRNHAWEIYTARFPFLLRKDPKLSAALARTSLWRIEADWIRLIDNRLGFGHKEEWTRPEC